jgi:anti-sigma B factor antagonist
MGTLDMSRESAISGNKEVHIIRLNGSLDAHTAPILDETIAKLIEEQKFFLVIDFNRLDYISSAGMGLFVGWIDTVRNKGGDIHMVRLKPNVLKVFQILGFNKIFKLYENEKQALEEF